MATRASFRDALDTPTRSGSSGPAPPPVRPLDRRSLWPLAPVGPAAEAMADGSGAVIARTNLRSWTRRFRRGRLEALDLTAARVLTQVRSVATRWPGAAVPLREPVLVQEGIPVVHLVGRLDFWKMVQQTDLGPTEPLTLYVLVHRRTLADPWECTCILTAGPFASLSSEPITFRSGDSPEAQIYVRFWRDLAGRCELVLSGLD